MNTKTIIAFALLTLAPLSASAQDAAQPSAGCSLLDASRDALFLTYEKAEVGERAAGARGGGRIILRLANNSTCAVLLKMEEPKKFVVSEAVPFVNSKFRSDAEDGELIPELTFVTQDEKHTQGAKSRTGDFFFEFRLLGGRSVTFAVPGDEFGKCNDILVPFNFEWEQKRSGSSHLLHRVSFPTGAIPAEVRRRLKSRC